ncbi:glucose-6-phosphate isomerase [Achromobacter sp. UBA4530]|uniref:glucose-6-phosphate isomerase n=1 Tax=Achromobacter sp. UBA4530 TaxID=1945912 RepID=UPI00257CB387|nr:glucose-6-phosphate isomerase [Achromobacter sp. UBA4530]
MVRRATGGPSDVSLSHTWQTLAEHLDEVRPRHLRDLFQLDPERGQRFSEEAAGWYLDYSKNRITRRTLELLLRLACTSRLPAKIDAMFNGDPVNSSEGRAALHVALRMPADASVRVDGRDVVPDVQRVLRRMENFAGKVRSGTWFGGTGKKIRNIVNLGIGGSAIGVGMACAALQHYGRRDMQFRFVSNMDGADFFLATRDLDPRETLFIVCSKTFHTPETLRNAAAARAWCLEDIQDEGALRAHFVAVTGNRDAAIAAGFAPEHVFDVWEWVNGRYSLCSAMGLALLTAIGPAAFREMLAGFHDMDTHFLSAPMKQNLPVLLGLMGVWNNNFLGARSVAILPYAHDLRRFPSYVQQLMMESNGKSVTQDGAPVGSITSPVYWGACGTNGQHSFHQLLHQGTQIVPCDFIGFLSPLPSSAGGHEELLANMYAQAQALAFGRPLDEGGGPGDAQARGKHRQVQGNRPSNTLLAAKLTPRSLGALVALYEHSAFTQGVIWDIDSFDQWGVELGKTLAAHIAQALGAGQAHAQGLDSSTRALVQKYLDAKAAGAMCASERT